MTDATVLADALAKTDVSHKQIIKEPTTMREYAQKGNTMTDATVLADTIKKAVELADGFSYQDYELTKTDAKQFFLDALAAQLVRQVELIPLQVHQHNGCTGVYSDEGDDFGYIEGPDRTLNTIKAILDSKVLQMAKHGITEQDIAETMPPGSER